MFFWQGKRSCWCVWSYGKVFFLWKRLPRPGNGVSGSIFWSIVMCYPFPTLRVNVLSTTHPHPSATPSVSFWHVIFGFLAGRFYETLLGNETCACFSWKCGTTVTFPATEIASLSAPVSLMLLSWIMDPQRTNKITEKRNYTLIIKVSILFFSFCWEKNGTEVFR